MLFVRPGARPDREEGAVNRSRPLGKTTILADYQLKMLTPEQVKRIDELLLSVGEYGEVRLIVQKRELRYLNRVESYKAWDDSLGKRA